MTNEVADKILEDWEAIAPPISSNATPTSIVYQPQPAIVPVHQPQPAPVRGKSESYYLKLAAIVVGFPCVTFLAWFVFSSSARQASTFGDQSTALGILALSKPGSVTIQQSCSTSFWGNPCSFPKVEIPQNQPANVQTPNTAIAINQPAQNPRLEEFRRLSLEDLNKIKAQTPAETAAADPVGWNALLTAYAEKGGR